MQTWFLLEDGIHPGSINMAVDEYLLHADLPFPILRFYQWSTPTLSLGMSQPVDRHVDLEEVHRHRIPVVRRLTGGKAVLHDQELTYSLTGSRNMEPYNKDLLDSYQEIARAFCSGFNSLGIPANMASRDTRALRGGVSSCFANPSAYEIVVEGRKLLGSAQKRTRTRVLQHGSLLLDYDDAVWNAVLKKKNNQGDSGRIISLNGILGKKSDINTVTGALISAFRHQFDVRFERFELDSSALATIKKLAMDNYPDLSGQLDSIKDRPI